MTHPQPSAASTRCRHPARRPSLGDVLQVIAITGMGDHHRLDQPIAITGIRTYASRLAARAVPLPVIAAQLGHADTRMTERHYAHLAPSYVADTVRAAFGSLGIGGGADNVAIFSPALGA